MSNGDWEARLALEDAAAERLATTSAAGAVAAGKTYDRGGKVTSKRVIECNGVRLPLTHMETTTLRCALEHVIANAEAFVTSIHRPAREARTLPSPDLIRHIAGGLLHHLLTGSGTNDRRPDLVAWRASVLADER